MVKLRRNKNKIVKNKTNFVLQENRILIYGKHPVLLAIEKKRREIFEIFVTKNTTSLLDEHILKHSLFSLKSKIKIVENSKIDSLIGSEEKNHQGFAIICSRVVVKTQFQLLEELYEIKDSKLPPLLFLDQVCDSNNIGAIIRNAVAFGVKKIILCEHNSPKENSAIAKASAGTIELVDLVVVVNFNQLIEKLKKIGYWFVALDGSAEKTIDQISDVKNIALIVGSEGSGIRKLVKENCDFLVKIKIDNQVESLNASVATAIALYQISKNNV
jgi:23S rRNA (guanosine2251-2'-O)-methyltransferase